MPWNTSLSSPPPSEPTPQPNTVEVSIGGTVTQEQLETVTVQFLAAAARNRGWSKFITKLNGVECPHPDNFRPNPGDSVVIQPYDEFGSV